MTKAGVHRVVWYRPSNGASHQGPVRRSTNFDEVPFLAVARALGDLWSYNSEKDMYIVSPEPDLHVFDINVLKDRCLVLATDGAWNVLSPEMAIEEVFSSERNNEKHMIDPQGGHTWVNPSKRLVDIALERWNSFKLRADNTSIVTVMLDPPGPPRAQVLKRIYSVQTPKLQNELKSDKIKVEKQKIAHTAVADIKQNSNENPSVDDLEKTSPPEIVHRNDLNVRDENSNANLISKKSNENIRRISDEKDVDPIAVISRYPNYHPNKDHNVVDSENLEEKGENTISTSLTPTEKNNAVNAIPSKTKNTSIPVPSYLVHPPPPPRNLPSNRPNSSSALESKTGPKISSVSKNVGQESEEQTPSSTSQLDIRETLGTKNVRGQNSIPQLLSPVQINQISSSDDEKTPPPLPSRPPGGHGRMNRQKISSQGLTELQNNNTCKLRSRFNDEATEAGLKNCNKGAESSEFAKNTRSKPTNRARDTTATSDLPKKDEPSYSYNVEPNITGMSTSAPRRPLRRSIIMPSGEEVESPNYNSDSENHHPVSHQLRSRATTRSSSVPLQCNSRCVNRQIRSTSCASDKKDQKRGDTKPSTISDSKVSSKVATTAVKQMAVNIDNQTTKSSPQPPPLPARPTYAQSKILRSSNTPNVKSMATIKLSPDKISQTPSPRVLRPRNTPNINKQSECMTPDLSSKLISTPKNVALLGKDKEKRIPTKITARAVKFFEENIKRNNTSLKRKRRSFDTSGNNMPINKSAKMVRTAHSTRSCTWNNHTHTAQTRSQLPNSLSKQPHQHKLTPSKCKGLKS